jgi:hypothetical protein
MAPHRFWTLSSPDDFTIYRETPTADLLYFATGSTATLYVHGLAVFRFNAEALLRDFARSEARRVIHLWNPPDVVRRWLETGDADLMSAARSAAKSAARSAARSAEWSAAEFAAWSAAYSAAESAAPLAAQSAAESAAQSAAPAAAPAAAESAAYSASILRLEAALDAVLNLGANPNTLR